MQRRYLILGVLALSACGGRLNPFNWFRRRPKVVEEAAPTTAQDPRGLMERVTSIAVDQTSTGVILRVTGLPPEQGYHDAELVALPLGEDGIKTYEFRVAAPATPQATGPERSREITAATALSLYQLSLLSGLRVVAATNAMTARP